jgi:hypothetical protein
MDLVNELRELIVRHVGGRSPSVKTVMDGVTIAHVDRPTPPTATMVEPSLAIVAQGTKRLVVNGVPYRRGRCPGWPSASPRSTATSERRPR